jgi:hypothetical protein
MTRIRTAVRRVLPDLADITDPGSVSVTASGGTTVTGPSTTSGVACRIAAANYQTARALFGEQAAAVIQFTLSLPHGTTIRPGWTVVVDGVTYSVAGVNDEGAWRSAVRAGLVRTVTVGG